MPNYDPQWCPSQGLPSNTWFLAHQNVTSYRSTQSHGRDRETDKQTDRQTDRPRYMCNNRVHLMLHIAMRRKVFFTAYELSRTGVRHVVFWTHIEPTFQWECSQRKNRLSINRPSFAAASQIVTLTRATNKRASC